MANQEAQTPDHGTALRHWVIAEYTQHERGRSWYVVASLVAAGLLIWALITNNFLFAVLIMLTVIILLVRHSEMPPQLMVSVFEDGIQVGEGFYPFKDLKSFWIIYEPPEVKMLYFDFKNAWRPRLPIPLQDENPIEVRRLLLKYLEEDLSRESEPTSDALSRLLRL